jgi:two-component system chemotaxis response regulator CheB
VTTKPDLVAVGTSLGGLNALLTVLRVLPAGFAAPIVVVQHRGAASDGSLAELLQVHTALRVVEAEDKTLLEQSTVYVAPADYHLLVEDRASLALSTEGPVRFARPSIDVLFESAAAAYGSAALAILLTGASDDGAAGLATIKRRGGRTMVQDPATAECATMPAAGIAAAAIDYILPLERIGPYLLSLVEESRI